MEKLVNIPQKAKVKIYWNADSSEYTREKKADIKSSFASKYNIPQENISVIFQPTKLNDKGEIVNATEAGITNIMDINYQRNLMKIWLEGAGKIADFEKIIEIDDKINKILKIEETDKRQKVYSIDWIEVDNFLCFGNIRISFDELKGVTVINSIPANFGGKSSLVEAIEFLLFGSCSKVKVNEDVFNLFSDKDKTSVSGQITIDNEKYIIERNFNRKKKKNGEWDVKTEVKYYVIMPDGSKENLIGEQSVQTTTKIVETIGDKADFKTIISCNSKNLEDLLDTKPTERGKLLTKFIGLEVLDNKEEQARKIQNEFKSKMLSNQYDILVLKNNIEENKNNITINNTNIGLYETQQKDNKEETDKLIKEKEDILAKKTPIDKDVLSVNPINLQGVIDTDIKKGIEYKNILINKQNRIKDIGELNFNEQEYSSLTQQDKTLSIKINTDDNEIRRLTKLNTDLKNGEICPTCKRKLDGISNDAHIKENADKILVLNKSKEENNNKLKEVQNKITILDKTKLLVNEKSKLEIESANTEVNMANLRSIILENRVLLEKYNSNVSAIKENQEFEKQAILTQSKIDTANYQKEQLIKNIQICISNIQQLEKDTINKHDIIIRIGEQEITEKLLKTYIDVVGRKGISRIVLNSVIPILNSEIQRILDEVAEFDLEISLNEKQDVEFIINDNGIEQDIRTGSGYQRCASALALRAVLSQSTCLPRINISILDETFGSVAAENLPNIKNLFDKIKEYFSTILLITHIDAVKEWGEKTITFNKIDHITNILKK